MTNQNNASAQAPASIATAPHEQETGLLNGLLAEGTSCVHEYAFDVKLQAALRVNASTPAHAIAVLEKVMDAAQCNGGMWPNGDPILFEASLAKSIDPVLFEIDGQELEVQGTLDDVPHEQGNVANCVEHAAAGKSGTFTAKYDQYAERNGQPFTILGAVDPQSYDADEGGEMFFIRFADGNVIEAWPEEVESATNQRANVLEITVHDFTGRFPGDVYDQTQTDDSIKDGDVLDLGAGNVAILVKAWPTIVVGEIENFHRLNADTTFETFKDGRYAASAAKAREISRQLLNRASVQAATPKGLRSLVCAASLSNGLLTLDDGTTLELADLVDFVNGVASKEIPSSNDAEHDLLVDVIGEAEVVLEQSGVRRILEVEYSRITGM